MKWTFLGYVLDVDRAELTGPEGPVHIERLPLELLKFLVENADRVVTRDEAIDAVWDGRIVSDTTISTAIKQARKAVGDNGVDQAVIKTVHGRGFRFVAALEREVPAQPAAPASTTDVPPVAAPEPEIQHGAGRPSIAVLRFVQLGTSADVPVLAEALPGELINGLSRIRWLHVIARGSSFRFDPTCFDPADVHARLGVRYILTGTVEPMGGALSVALEIQSAETGTLVWSERFTTSVEEIEFTRSEIVAEVISALEISIPEFEAMHARHLGAEKFDAWSHFHLGLSHMYRFTSGDNLIAADHFRAALGLDPHFARAHAGLSFTHWQNGFMFFRGDRAENLRLAQNSAQDALAIDAYDPFVNFNMGRAQWLEGDIDGARAWFDRAISINPNYAQCHYNNGLVLAMDGKAKLAHLSSEKAISLSPLDPLGYAMLAVRAWGSILEEDYAAAVGFAEQAMRLPGAHVYIAFIAALSNELAARREAAERWRDHGLASRPDFSSSMFLAAFPFRDKGFRNRLVGSFSRMGIPE